MLKKFCIPFLLATLTVVAIDPFPNYPGPANPGDEKYNHVHYTYLTGPTNYMVVPGDQLIVAICSAGNVTVNLPQINTNWSNYFFTWELKFEKATKDNNALVIVPWTNGPTSYGFGTNTITFMDYNKTAHSQTNNLTETNYLATYTLGFGPDGQSVGPVP